MSGGPTQYVSRDLMFSMASLGFIGFVALFYGPSSAPGQPAETNRTSSAARYLWSTVALLGGLTVLLRREIPWLIRFPFSIMAGLTIVRFFVLYHDHQHGAIMKGSKLADLVMLAFGLATLNPPSVWKPSHDHHHGNNCKNFDTNVGSYPSVTVEVLRKRFCVATVSLCCRPSFADDCTGIRDDFFLWDVRGAAFGQS